MITVRILRINITIIYNSLKEGPVSQDWDASAPIAMKESCTSAEDALKPLLKKTTPYSSVSSLKDYIVFL